MIEVDQSHLFSGGVRFRLMGGEAWRSLLSQINSIAMLRYASLPLSL